MHEYHQSPSCFRTTGTVPKTPPPTYKLYNSQRNRARKGIHLIYPRLATDPHCLPPLYRERPGNRSSRRQVNISTLSQTAESQMVGAVNQAYTTDSSIDNPTACNTSNNGFILSPDQTADNSNTLFRPSNTGSQSSSTYTSSACSNNQSVLHNVSSSPNSSNALDNPTSGQRQHSNGPASAATQRVTHPSGKLFYDTLGEVTHL